MKSFPSAKFNAEKCDFLICYFELITQSRATLKHVCRWSIIGGKWCSASNCPSHLKNDSNLSEEMFSSNVVSLAASHHYWVSFKYLLLLTAHCTALLVTVASLCSLCGQRRDVSTCRKTISLHLPHKHLKVGGLPVGACFLFTELRGSSSSKVRLDADPWMQI